jgi:DNA-directed RNA polymerase subunit M/transcription elongation factor TFIIS
MRFCSLCKNMMYVKVDDDTNLVYYCKFCNNSLTEAKENGSILVIDDNKVDDNIKYRQYENKNIVHDPTLPRVNNIVCPNSSCTKKENHDNEVIYIKYDFANMKYLYYCCHCEHFWRTN